MRNAAPTSESSQVTEQSVRRNSAAATTEEEEEEKGQKKTHTHKFQGLRGGFHSSLESSDNNPSGGLSTRSQSCGCALVGKGFQFGTRTHAHTSPPCSLSLDGFSPPTHSRLGGRQAGRLQQLESSRERKGGRDLHAHIARGHQWTDTPALKSFFTFLLPQLEPNKTMFYVTILLSIACNEHQHVFPQIYFLTNTQA